MATTRKTKTDQDYSTEIVTLNQGAPVTTSLAMADGTRNQHKNVLELIRSNQGDFEEFGRVAFETQPFETPGGIQTRDFVTLNEDQATLLITYMRNTPVVRGFKKRLIKAFRLLVEQVRAQQIQPTVFRSANYRPRLTAPLVRVMREYLGFENTTAWLLETYPEMFGRLTGPFPRGPQQAFQPSLPLVPALGMNFESAAGLNTLPEPTATVPEKTTRISISEVVRGHGLSAAQIQDRWRRLYDEALYVLSVNLRLRAKNRGISPLDVAEADGLLERLYTIAHDLYVRKAA